MNASLTALSPLDGRYHADLAPLSPYLSEFALMRERVRVEIAWFETLSRAPIQAFPPLSESASAFLKNIVAQFSLADAERIKAIEAETKHDLKAVEYFIKERLQQEPSLAPLSEWLHFSCTSEDINNLAYALMLQSAHKREILPNLKNLCTALKAKAHAWHNVALLARTHGQTASPTTIGKELAVFCARIEPFLTALESWQFHGKFNGAVGNFNAHLSAFPDLDWLMISKQFVEHFGLHWQKYTTQIEPHDQLALYFQYLSRINMVLIDFARDMWGYISRDLFKQQLKAGEVGSSTMPHKINPIDFENAEGNLSLSHALFNFLSERLTVSRWQRDLVDSTLLRNVSVALGHHYLGVKNLLKGFQKLALAETQIAAELDAHWEVLTEAIQTVMRKMNCPFPYEQLKQFSRGKQLGKADIQQFIQSLTLDERVKQTLLQLTPENYVGLAARLAKEI